MILNVGKSISIIKFDMAFNFPKFNEFNNNSKINKKSKIFSLPKEYPKNDSKIKNTYFKTEEELSNFFIIKI